MTAPENEFERAARAMRRKSAPPIVVFFLAATTIGTAIGFQLGTSSFLDRAPVGALVGFFGGLFLWFLPAMLRRRYVVRRANREAFDKAWREGRIWR